MIRIYLATAVAAFAFAGRAANLIQNADLSLDDGMGGVLGWSDMAKSDCGIEAHNSAPGTMTITFTGQERSYFRQSPLALKSGGRFRLSAEVRTAGLGGAAFQLLLWDSGWHRDVRSKEFPDDTKGEWVRVSWEGNIMKSEIPDGYTVGICGDGGSNGTARAEVRNFTLEPLDDETARESPGLPASLTRRIPIRIVPIEPLLSRVCAKSGAFTFYWPGTPACDIQSCTLKASVDGASPLETKLGADGRAQVAFGRIRVGEHRLAVSVVAPDGKTLAENDYRFQSCPPLPKGPEGKRLNNFVTELVNQPLENGEVQFFRPTAGWVWISFEGTDRAARGFLDGCAVPAVEWRLGDRRHETMRDVAAGWHTLKVTGATGGKLRIHAVKVIATTLWPLATGPCDFSKGRYKFSFAFARRFLMSMNTVNGAEAFLRERNGPEEAYYASRGFGFFGGVNIKTSSPVWMKPEEQWQKLTEGSWSLGHDVSVDESQIHAGRQQHLIFAENVWKMYEQRPAQRVNLYWGDATEYWYSDPKGHVTELMAMANTGNGRGVVLPETYAPVLRTAEETDRWIDLFAQQVKSLGEIAPGAREMTVYNVSPWVNLGHWSDYPCPEGDIKAHFARMIQAFATRPEFAANSGIAAGASGAAEEELRRWHSRLFRYYAIEGGTENLADVYGFRWAPGFVKNCDFAEGLEGWTATPAAGGEVRHVRRDKYGTRVQGRKKVPVGTGDDVAEFVTSEKGPNRLSQKITGLEPGRYYALMFCAPNAANLDKAMESQPPLAFSARLEGAEEIAGLRFRHIGTTRRKPKGSGPKENVYLAIYRYVFRAKAAEATLTFEDRAEDGSALAADGRQALNYIIFRPYYVESPEEVEELVDIIAGHDPVYDGKK